MSTYIIGDVHGCYEELKSLFELICFNPDKDRAIFVGDLVGHGQQNLAVLKFVMNLGQSIVHILGNHDLILLHQLLNFQNNIQSNKKQEIIDWLLGGMLFYKELEHNIIITHAGIPPTWTLTQAESFAEFCHSLKRESVFAQALDTFVTSPILSFSETFTDEELLAYILYGFTKIRYCTANGEFDSIYHCTPGLQPKNLFPWYFLRYRKQKDNFRIFFGHWAALGIFQYQNMLCCDSGCVWGHTLLAIELCDNLIFHQVQNKKTQRKFYESSKYIFN